MRDVWEAMSDKTRREILVMLKERNLSAGEIAEKFSLTKATVSHHLSVLRQAGLVDTEAGADGDLFAEPHRIPILSAGRKRPVCR